MVAWRGEGEAGGQPPVIAALAGGVYPLSFPPQKEDARLAVSVGDVRGKMLVEPRTRPDLADLVVHERLPDYLEVQRRAADRGAGRRGECAEGSAGCIRSDGRAARWRLRRWMGRRSGRTGRKL